MAITVGKGVQLCLLAIPENSQCHEAHDVADELGRGPGECAPQLALAVDHLAGGHVEIQNQQRHGHGEDAVAERRKPLQTLTGNLVVRSGHGALVYST